MVDVSGKQISLRTATASGKIFCNEDTIRTIKENKLPKGDLFNIAKAAALLASKNTSNLIPHCHPVTIDNMEVNFEVSSNFVKIEAMGKSISRTGIEMEVLTAVSIAALTIYDLLKPIDKQLEISEIQLLDKKGGKTDLKNKVKKGHTVAVLVCSDSTAARKREDNSGIIIKKMFEKYNAEIKDYQIIPDNPEDIKQYIEKWADDGIEFIISTGGTGISPRDNTVDTIKDLLNTEITGISEAMRTYGGMRTPWAMFSRSVAGIYKNSVIVTLPGSSNGARESLEALLPGLFHAQKMLKGGGH